MSSRFGDRTPSPPPVVVDWMERFGGEEGDLLDRVIQAIGETLERPGRNRDGAFALLAADGLLTYAVEDAAGSPDPEAALTEILARVTEGE